MADQKLNDLNDRTTTAGTDIVYAVSDPSGSAADNKVSLDNLFKRGTVTTSSPVIDAAQTWDASGTTFTGLKLNVTDTASASGSLLMDLQVGGSSRLSVRKSGTLLGPSDTSWTIASSTPAQASAATAGLNLILSASNATAGTSAGAAAGGAISITAGNAALLTSGNANGGSITIRPGNPVGSGTPGVLALVGASGTTATNVGSTGGAITLTSGTATNNGLGCTTGSISILTADTPLTGFSSSGSVIIGSGAISEPANSNAGSFNVVTNAIRRFQVTGTGLINLGPSDATNDPVTPALAQTLSVQSVATNANNTNRPGKDFTIQGSRGTGTGAGGSIIFQVAPAAGSSGTAQNALATFLEATSARAFNLYNTTDVTTNFERGKIAWESNVLRIGTEKGGTGTARALEFQTDGTTRLTIAATGNVTSNANFVASGSLGIQLGNGAAPIYWASRSQIYSPANGNIQLTNSSTNDFGRLQFGGTTSSFPALKRDSASLIVRLADDSANAALECAALTVTGNLTISTKDIVTDTTTGTKIGTATTQKIGFYNATPVVQPGAVADATDNATAITQLNALLAHMRTLGLIAT